MDGLSALWVEGKDDQHIVWSLVKYHAVPEVFQVIERQGIENLLKALPVQLTKGSDLARLGVVVDADVDLEARWASIHDILQRSGYTQIPMHPHPDGTVIREKEKPVIGVWLMPGNVTAGMVEDFAASLIPAGDRLWQYSERVLDEIPGAEVRFSPSKRSKARLHSWLAWQEEPGSPIGLAVTKRYLNADAPEAVRFVAWIRRLFEDGLVTTGSSPGATYGR